MATNTCTTVKKFDLMALIDFKLLPRDFQDIAMAHVKLLIAQHPSAYVLFYLLLF
jgi:predicted Zn-dependent protease with MMP-like domain